MRKRVSYAVLGLGRYGRAVAKELIKNGMDVLAVDINADTVNSVSGEIPFSKCADVTDPDVIKDLGISEIDTVIITMASSFESTIMTLTLCKEVGVKNVIVKCANEFHEKILTRLGADKVIVPERDSGIRLAKNLVSSSFIDVIELSDNFSIMEVDILSDWVGKTLVELNLRNKYKINVIAVYKNGNVSVDIDPNEELCAGMKLIVLSDTRKLSKLVKDLGL